MRADKAMKQVNIVLMGFGQVGQAFLQVVQKKKESCQRRFGLDICLYAIFRRGGALYSSRPLDIREILECHLSSALFKNHPHWNQELKPADVLMSLSPGVLVECTPSNLRCGESGLSHIRLALDTGWHVVTANKGPLVCDFCGLKEMAKRNGLALKFSGATAAALPALDTALYSLAGAEISRIEGILNGTTNYILTKMKEGVDYQQALQEAQSKGIAESDPSLDVSGLDTAAKVLIITNAVFQTDFSLENIRIEGIEKIPDYLFEQGKKEDKALKLLGRCVKEGKKYRLEVILTLLDSSHPLFGVDGTTKAITFQTDTMNSITISGGKSDPRGTGASLLKDIINIYREDF